MISSPACAQPPIDPRITRREITNANTQTPKKAAKLKPSILHAALKFFWDLVFGLWDFSVAGAACWEPGFVSG
jgi:hypothetical protein